jgi:hypothetical protein
MMMTPIKEMIRDDTMMMIIQEVALLLRGRLLGIRKEERINLRVVIMKNMITEMIGAEMIGMPPPEDARTDSPTTITLHNDGHELITTMMMMMMMIHELRTDHNDGHDITTMMMIHTHHNDGRELITTMMMIHALRTDHNDGQDLIYTMIMRLLAGVEDIHSVREILIIYL